MLPARAKKRILIDMLLAGLLSFIRPKRSQPGLPSINSDEVACQPSSLPDCCSCTCCASCCITGASLAGAAMRAATPRRRAGCEATCVEKKSSRTQPEKAGPSVRNLRLTVQSSLVRLLPPRDDSNNLNLKQSGVAHLVRSESLRAGGIGRGTLSETRYE